jgi:2,3-dihydroxybenzoate-AMP ligase
MEKKRQSRTYLEGAVPYPIESILEYARKGWWQDLTFGDILDRSAEAQPHKTAVIDGKTRLTYAQLRAKADRFAIGLRALGIKRYDRILLQLPNRSEFLIAFYGLQRIGAVPVLAIPRHGFREVSHFFSVIEPAAWILPLKDGKQDFRPLIDAVRAETTGLRHLIVLNDGETVPPNSISMDTLLSESESDYSSRESLGLLCPDPNDVAVILLTGGTTGMPKGVPRTHNSYLANIRYTNIGTRPEDVRALATPIGHSMAHQGPVGGSIFYGATLVLLESPRARPILNAVEKHRITMLSLVPTQLEDILNLPDLEKHDLTSLRMVRTAGAALNPETVQRAEFFFRSVGADFEGGGFGSSEGPCATHHPDEPPEIFRTSIGRPMCDGDHWKVIDEGEKELPPNIEGELAAKGPCVFTGYYRSEDENQEIFTRDGYYKMGDIGRIDEEGYIHITGRRKDIIQRGGEGMIPSEMENLLRLHPSVEAAAVVGMPDHRLGERACAYVVTKPAATVVLEELVEFLKSQGAGVLLLPERLETIKQLPKTAVGKIDKQALRQDIRVKLRREGKP